MTSPALLPAVLPLGEGAWTVSLGTKLDPITHAAVLALAERVAAAQLAGVTEIIPAYVTVTVRFDPLVADAEGIREWLENVGRIGRIGRTGRTGRRLIRIPVRYDGPDLLEVAERTCLSPSEVIERHCSREYQVYLLGFAPGFAFLGDLDPALALPRRSTPRTRVPAGSVAIAGSQTGIYPIPTPGGWHLIGSTTVRLFDPAKRPPTLFLPGDRVRFEAAE